MVLLIKYGKRRFVSLEVRVTAACAGQPNKIFLCKRCAVTTLLYGNYVVDNFLQLDSGVSLERVSWTHLEHGSVQRVLPSLAGFLDAPVKVLSLCIFYCGLYMEAHVP